MSISKGSENYANNIHKREVSILLNLLRTVLYICIHHKNNEVAIRWGSTALYLKKFMSWFLWASYLNRV